MDSNSDEKILSYNDVVLRRSDLDILSGPYYLNDRIVEFYFSYLASCYPSQNILFVPPAISFWITNCPDKESLKDFIEPLKLPDKEVVIFSVNNNEDVTEAEGGSHWSLLAYERKNNVFIHHDSIAGFNRWYAKTLYKSVVEFIGSSDSELDVRFIECPTAPQQENAHDCGLYVTAIAKVICQWLENGRSEDGADSWFSNVKEQVGTASVSEMRKEILRLIRSLMVKE